MKIESKSELLEANRFSANELRRTLGGSYKTAWFAAHRIRTAMRGHGAELLRSLVEAEQRESGGDLQRANLRVVARVRRLVGPHHQLSVKYIPAYLDERRWRADNHGNPHVFQDTLQALLEGEGISYERLVAAA